MVMSDKKSPEFAVFNIEGGIGKHVSSTAVVKAYKKNHPTTKIVVVCAWPEVYLNNTDVHRVYRLGNVPYFYQDYILDKDTKVFAQEPYKETAHITKKQHLIHTWCDMLDIKYSGETPYMNFNMREKAWIDPELAKIQKVKPILMFQPFGGPGKNHQSDPYSWARDIHPEVAQTIVNQLKDHYQIIHICYDFHHKLNDVIRYEKEIPKKQLFNMLNFADRCLFVDSSLQHAAAALGKSSTVVWVATQPELFGYNIHTNIKAPVQLPKGTIDSYLYDYTFTGAVHECPYEDVNQMFDVNAIVQSLLQPARKQVQTHEEFKAETAKSQSKRAASKKKGK
jgi:hypothetical protein